MGERFKKKSIKNSQNGHKKGMDPRISTFTRNDYVKKWDITSFELDQKTLQRILNNLPELLSVQKPDHTVVFYNKEGCEILNMPLEEILGKKCYELIGRTEGCEKCSAREAKEKKKPHSMEIYIKELDMYLDCISTPILDDEGNVMFVVEQHRDITQRKTAEKALLESEEQYRKLVEYSPTAIIIECEDEIVYANEAAANLAGENSIEKVIGKPVINYVHPEFINKYKEILKQVLKEKENTPFTKGKIIRADGLTVDVECSSIPFNYQGKEAAQIIIRDRSRKEKIEEELLKASKLESVGLLAGGIAHDFNNLLAVIMGNISISRKRLDDKEKVEERLEDAEKAVKQAVELTRQLRTFAHGGEPRKDTEDIVSLLKEVTALSLSGSKVKYDLCASENVYYVDIDIGQISQVINNIIINAVQAMPDGGNLKVRAENFDIDSKEQECNNNLEEGKYVRVSIEDEGEGIPGESINKIFDPFYSTKEKGSGLGLAICYSVINKHGGKIEVESEPAKGTVFHIYLPASINEYSYQAEKKEIYYKGSGKILVMDDEDMVLKVVGEMLVYLGYKVEFAKDGGEAIESYKKALELGTPYDAVILDLTIAGGMGGEKALKNILEMDPEANAIVSSGYSHDPVMADYQSYGFKGFVTKPFRIEELSKVLHEVLCSIKRV